MLLDQIKATIGTALKSGKKDEVETLRFLLAGIRNDAIDKYGAAGESAVTDADVISVVKKQVKTHKESIVAFAGAGRTDLVEKEQKQLQILESYLPKQLTDEEIEVLLKPLAATEEKNFGPLMGQAMKIIAGRADGDRVSNILRKLIS